MPQPIIDYSRRYTVEEYFALDAASDIRLEYFDGRILPHLDDIVRDLPNAMDGATKLHNRVLSNVWFALESQLRALDSTRDLFTHNISTELRAALGTLYPDIVMTTIEPDNDILSVVFPALIVEVLTNTTEKADRGWKFDAYRAIPSIEQIILINPHSVSVDSYIRNASNATWELAALREWDEELIIPTAELRMTLAEVYHRVPLDALDWNH